MPAFAALDYRRLDVLAVVTFGGVATVVPDHRAAARAWLVREGYAIDTLDFSGGLAAAIPALGDLFRWEEQFGYALTADRRSMDALRDGFDFEIPEGGRVLELVGAEAAWREDPRWTYGLLAIVQEHCRAQLALGRRFMALLVLLATSPMIRAPIEQASVPYPAWPS
jgi:hypothetical protein